MRSLGIPAIAAVVGVCAMPGIAAAVPATVYVRSTSNDMCDGTVDTDYDRVSTHCAKRTIQAGINAVAQGGTVRVGAGTYRENVFVTKGLVLWGAGSTTVVQPAVSRPNPCANSSLCGSNASNVFLIRASNVTIQYLVVDGDNPLLNSGLWVGGANIDARNGIIEDHNSGVYDHLNVHDVTIKNVFLRAINAASGGNDFSFRNNTITNVQGGPGSVGIFAYDSRGIIRGNTLSATNDAIGVNHSRGVKIQNNVVSNSGSGIHVDNNKVPAPGVAVDLVRGNTVQTCKANAFGIWVYVPGADALIDSNTVHDCDVGYALVGGGAASSITFTNNTATGDDTRQAGILVTTDSDGFGDFETEGLFTGNTIVGFDSGAVVEQDGGKNATAYFDDNHFEGAATSGIENHGTAVVYNTCFKNDTRGLLNGFGGVAEVHSSSFVDNAFDGVENMDSASLDATGNWWDSAGGPDEGQTVVGDVTYDPWLFSDPIDCN